MDSPLFVSVEVFGGFAPILLVSGFHFSVKKHKFNPLDALIYRLSDVLSRYEFVFLNIIYYICNASLKCEE